MDKNCGALFLDHLKTEKARNLQPHFVSKSDLNLSHAECLVNPFPNKPCFLCVCSTSLLKTLWEKKKLLVTSNFFFSNSVFHPFLEIFAIFIKFEIVVCKLFQFGPIQKLLFGKGLNL